jgi:hypothetical protein
MMLLVLGCTTRDGAFSSPSHDSNSESSVSIVDAGVVFTDRSSYLCFPLERFGLERADEVLSVASTCDCIRPQLVEYLTAEKSSDRAVLLEFKHNESSKKSGYSDRLPAKLGVTIELKLSDGRLRSLALRLLLTSLTKESVR